MAKNATGVRGRPGRPAVPPAPGSGPDRAVRELTRVFKSLADEHRLRILFLLARCGEMHVSAIGEEVGQSQPAVSHHLRELRNAGLIDYRRDGKFNYYALNPDGMTGLLDQMFPTGPARVVLGGLEVSFRRK